MSRLAQKKLNKPQVVLARKAQYVLNDQQTTVTQQSIPLLFHNKDECDGIIAAFGSTIAAEGVSILSLFDCYLRLFKYIEEQ
jgi:hypothetical protein